MQINTGLILTLALTGCASYTSLDALNSPRETTVSPNRQTQHDLTLLTQVYHRYKGTPYRYGGTNRRGFDCSGFIQTALNEAFGILTPRTTEQLASAGIPIRRDQLQVGDVLIFRSNIKQLHAGIYMGDDQFIHASTAVGVTQSTLDNTYWLQRYVRARRYF